MSKLTPATTCHFLGTFTIDPAIASSTAERSVGPYGVDVGANQIVLPGSSHSRLGFSLRKEARAGRMRDRQTLGVLEDISLRLHDMLAKEFEKN